MGETWEVQTSSGVAGAVAIIRLRADSAGELDAALVRLGLPALGVGRIARHTLLDVDDGLLARWSPTCAHLMPHGGPVVVRNMASALVAAGVPPQAGPADPMDDYPEARTEVEARMLATLARCASPRGIDLLLDQPRRWGRTPCGEPGVSEEGVDRVRNRMLSPPLVVALGPPNVGKSTLVNALAGRGVSITADEPGTTRDHVGVELDLDGLVVHYLDTPGLGPGTDAGAIQAGAIQAGAIQAEAQSLARQAARGADLILLCGAAEGADPRPLLAGVDCTGEVLVAALRADLAQPAWAFDVCLRGLHRPGGDAAGLETLVDRIVEALVPASAVNDPRPWRFWA